VRPKDLVTNRRRCIDLGMPVIGCDPLDEIINAVRRRGANHERTILLTVTSQPATAWMVRASAFGILNARLLPHIANWVRIGFSW
jgi:hypothetical protein